MVDDWRFIFCRWDNKDSSVNKTGSILNNLVSCNNFWLVCAKSSTKWTSLPDTNQSQVSQVACILLVPVSMLAIVRQQSLTPLWSIACFDKLDDDWIIESLWLLQLWRHHSIETHTTSIMVLRFGSRSQARLERARYLLEINSCMSWMMFDPQWICQFWCKKLRVEEICIDEKIIQV